MFYAGTRGGSGVAKILEQLASGVVPKHAPSQASQREDAEVRRVLGDQRRSVEVRPVTSVSGRPDQRS